MSQARHSTQPVAASSRSPGQGVAPGSVADRLFREGYVFDFFQAVRLIQALEPDRARVGHGGPPWAEAVRFRAHASLSFPPSSIADLRPPAALDQPAELIQPFLGLTGPSGVLPRHYTELILRLGQERQLDERHALRDWLDLFNHRLVGLFFRAWEKYRPSLADASERASDGPESHSSPFSRTLFSFVGIGTPGLQDRLGPRGGSGQQRVNDLSLIRYSGLLAHHPRSAEGLRAILSDYFSLNVAIEQFRGRWLTLEPASQSRLGVSKGANNRLGDDVVVGERVWDVQGAFRIRLGPLSYRQFRQFLPDSTQASACFPLAHLVRLYVGPTLDFDLQLVLKRAEIPRCQLPVGSTEGPVLGWDCWLIDHPPALDSDDVIFPDADLEAPTGLPAPAASL